MATNYTQGISSGDVGRGGRQTRSHSEPGLLSIPGQAALSGSFPDAKPPFHLDEAYSSFPDEEKIARGGLEGRRRQNDEDTTVKQRMSSAASGDGLVSTHRSSHGN